MYILSQDGNTLINSNRIVCINKLEYNGKYTLEAVIDICCEAKSTTYCVDIASYDTELECQAVFEIISARMAETSSGLVMSINHRRMYYGDKGESYSYDAQVKDYINRNKEKKNGN